MSSTRSKLRQPKNARQHSHQSPRLVAEEMLHERGGLVRLALGTWFTSAWTAMPHMFSDNKARTRTSTEPPTSKVGTTLGEFGGSLDGIGLDDGIATNHFL